MSIHVPTLLEGILEATAIKAQAEARIVTIRAALEAEARRRLTVEGAAPAWTTPQLGRVRLDPAGKWEARVADDDTFGSYVAEHYPTEATVVVYLNAPDAAEAIQALEFIGVTPTATRVEVRPAWVTSYLKGLAVDVEEERDDNAQVIRTVTAVDDIGVVPGIGVTRSETKLVVTLDAARRTAAVDEARSTATALVDAATEDDDEAPVDHAALDARRQQLEALHADQLATIADGHGLGRSGTKAALAERIARAELATGLIVRPASTLAQAEAVGQQLAKAADWTDVSSPLPEGTEVEEVTTLPAPEPIDHPVEEVPDGGDVADMLEESPEQEAATLTPYDDDRPGMMRVHIAEQRGRAIEALGSREVLRQHAKRLGVNAAGTKSEVALRLAQAGHTATTLTQETTP